MSSSAQDTLVDENARYKRVIRSAEELFKKVGFRAVTMELVAREVEELRNAQPRTRAAALGRGPYRGGAVRLRRRLSMDGRRNALTKMAAARAIRTVAV